jgi:hypothetical protein
MASPNGAAGEGVAFRREHVKDDDVYVALANTRQRAFTVGMLTYNLEGLDAVLQRGPRDTAECWRRLAGESSARSPATLERSFSEYREGICKL